MSQITIIYSYFIIHVIIVVIGFFFTSLLHCIPVNRLEHFVHAGFGL